MKAIASNCNASCTEPGLTDARARLLSTMVERVVEGRDLDADDLDGSLAASTNVRAAARVHACPIDRSPICICGHGRARHQLDFNGGDTCELWCDCAMFRYPSPAVITNRGWSSCSDICNCGVEHTEGRVYFVSARRMRKREVLTMLILGPFATHGEAIEAIVAGRTLTEKRYARADEYAYGTCALAGDTKEIGVLDERYVAPTVPPAEPAQLSMGFES